MVARSATRSTQRALLKGYNNVAKVSWEAELRLRLTDSNPGRLWLHRLTSNVHRISETISCRMRPVPRLGFSR